MLATVVQQRQRMLCARHAVVGRLSQPAHADLRIGRHAFARQIHHGQVELRGAVVALGRAQERGGGTRRIARLIGGKAVEQVDVVVGNDAQAVGGRASPPPSMTSAARNAARPGRRGNSRANGRCNMRAVCARHAHASAVARGRARSPRSPAPRPWA
jgi:hypothetical protein